MSAATGSAAATRTAAEWVQGFAERWRVPADAETFCPAPGSPAGVA